MARNDPPPRRPRWQAHPGTERGDRLPDALAPGYFAPDERSLAALAANAARFAKQIAFFDLRDRPDGTWERWFTHDEALVFAAIADADVKVLRGSQFESMDLATDENVLVRILAAARRLDRWYRLLAVIDRPGAQALVAELRRTIEATLAPELRWALAHVQASDVAERLRDELDTAWGDVSVGGGGGDYSWDRARALGAVRLPGRHRASARGRGRKARGFAHGRRPRAVRGAVPRLPAALWPCAGEAERIHRTPPRLLSPGLPAIHRAARASGPRAPRALADPGVRTRSRRAGGRELRARP